MTRARTKSNAVRQAEFKQRRKKQGFKLKWISEGLVPMIGPLEERIGWDDEFLSRLDEALYPSPRARRLDGLFDALLRRVSGDPDFSPELHRIATLAEKELEAVKALRDQLQAERDRLVFGLVDYVMTLNGSTEIWLKKDAVTRALAECLGTERSFPQT